MHTTPEGAERLIDTAALMRLTGLKSRASVWRHVRDGILPKPLKLGGSTRFVEAEVTAVIRAAMANRPR